MKGIRFLHLFLYMYLMTVTCERKEEVKSKKIMPYFRRKVEEIEDKKNMGKTDKDEPRSNLVSVLVKNVKEIFDDIVENAEINSSIATNNIEPSHIAEKTKSLLANDSADILFRSSVNVATTFIPTYSDAMLYENLSLDTLLDDKHAKSTIYGKNARNNQLSKDPKYVAKTDKKEREVKMVSQTSMSTFPGNYSDPDLEHDPRRSCIMCNNVASEDCNNPKNKLIQSIMCERDEDMCYSMHTPFGIIDRGCFNTHHNLTTYVCSCNLCNYISISEMPYGFKNKRSWVDNVIEISRVRNMRKSVFKDISCLRCEVNTTQHVGDMLDSANCLEGNIGNIAVEECDQNEVCAVKALRSDGYIWRGCIKAPLYNYWWSFCDYDLCNYDPIISLYDFV